MGQGRVETKAIGRGPYYLQWFAGTALLAPHDRTNFVGRHRGVASQGFCCFGVESSWCLRGEREGCLPTRFSRGRNRLPASG